MSTSNTAAATASGNKENPPAASKLKGIVKQVSINSELQISQLTNLKKNIFL